MDVVKGTAEGKKLFLGLLVLDLIVLSCLEGGSDSNSVWPGCMVFLIMLLAFDHMMQIFFV